MYVFSSRIRYSEADAEGILKIPALIDYFQDCSTFQSEDAGYGVRWLVEHRRAWVVNAWQIEIGRLPQIGERVTIGTNPYEIRGFMGLRNFFMDAEGGERLVIANSVWAYLDIEKGAVERVPEGMKEAYGLGEKLSMNYLSRKLPFPEDGDIAEGESIEVHSSMLDTNRHVNNAQSIRLALDTAFGETTPKIGSLRAEYKKQARLHDVFYPRVSRRADDSIVTIALNDGTGTPYCTVETRAIGKGAG